MGDPTNGGLYAWREGCERWIIGWNLGSLTVCIIITVVKSHLSLAYILGKMSGVCAFVSLYQKYSVLRIHSRIIRNKN